MANARRKLTQENYEAIRDHLFDRIVKTGEEVKNHFPNLLRAAIEAEVWKYFTDAEGRPFKNLVEWLHYAYPNGASMGHGKHAISYGEALKLTEAASDVHRALKEEAPSQRVRKQNANKPMPRRAKPSIYARLEGKNPKAYEEYLFGHYRSPTEAAKAVGLVKDRPKQNLSRAKSAFKKMTAKERAEFLKWIKDPDKSS